MARIVAIMLTAFCLSACAFGDETLMLSLSDEAARPGVISQASPTVIAVNEFVDERPDRKPVGKDETADPKRPYLVGYKRNGYGQNTGNILSEQLTTEIVQSAFEKMLIENGHQIDQDNAVVALGAAVKDFWLDYKVGLVTVEFFGTVEADVSLTDNATGEVVFSEVFTGHNSRKTAGGLSGTWTEVMNAALSDVARQISLSDDFKDALDAAGQPTVDDAGDADAASSS